MKKYSRVSYEVRCQIYAFMQTSLSIPVIAKRLGFHKSTIYREIKRNTWDNYHPSLAQKLAQERYKRCRREYSITKRHLPLIRYGIRHHWSPEQIAGRIKKDLKSGPSHCTVYKFMKSNGYQSYLRRYKKRGGGRYRQRKRGLENGLRISQRPKIANERGRIGDWERDTMHTKDGTQLLVCVDRKSRYTKIAKVLKRNSQDVDLLTKKIITETGRKILSITNDNGGDFKGKRGIKERVFFCDPHKPQQRGTVENTIGLLRQFIKRKTDLSEINSFKYLEDMINFRPRKVLGYKTPFEVYYGQKLHWQL